MPSVWSGSGAPSGGQVNAVNPESIWYASPASLQKSVLLAGVEPIPEAQPKGSSHVVLGPWTVGMGKGEGIPECSRIPK